MGAWDIPILIGAAGIGAYFIITNPDILGGILPHGDSPPPEDGGGTEEEPEVIPGGEDGGGTEEGEGGGGGTSGDKEYDCAKACRNCWCKSYSENCSGKCSRCCGGSRIASKCDGQGVKKCVTESFRAYPYSQRLNFSNAYS